MLLLFLGFPACHPTTPPVETPAAFPYTDVTVYTRAQGEAEGGMGVIVAVDRGGDEVWRHTVPPADNPYGSTLLDADITAQGTILYTVWNKGIFEVDANGAPLWFLDDPEATHDVDRLPNGNTLYTRGFARRGDAQVVEVDPNGDRVWSWDGLDAFQGDPYDGMVDEKGGWMHPNGVQRLDDGTTLVCCRNFNALVVLDASAVVIDAITFNSSGSSSSVPTTGTIPGDSPADCRLAQDEGRYLVAVRKPYYIMEIDRTTHDPVWRWFVTVEQEGLQLVRTMAGLPDGNRLFLAQDQIVELDAEGAIDWEIYPPELPRAYTKDWEMADTGLVDPDTLDRPLYRVLRVDTDGNVWGG